MGMGFYDIIDDIAERQLQKTDTGDSRIYGVVLGIVAKNYDKTLTGRVCVAIPVRNPKGTKPEEATLLKWARLALPSSGKKWGHYFVPEVGDQVLLAFEEGNIEKPYIIGCVSKNDESFVSNSVTEKNEIKKIMTRNGNNITFTDMDGDEEGDGGKDSLEISTGSKDFSQIIKMENEGKTITLMDKKKNTSLLMENDEETAKITLTAKKNITLKVGDNISMILNGEAGSIVIKAKEIKLEASESNITIKSGQSVKLDGVDIKMSGTSSVTAESDGKAVLKGSVVQLG